MASVLSGLGHSVRVALTPSDFEARKPDLEGVAYRAPSRGVAPLVDVYRPRAEAPAAGAPSALLVHGGAFVVGSRRQRSVRFVASRLAEAGLVVGAADYRLLFRGGPLSAQRDDIAALRRFWTDRAVQWRLDPSRVSVVGFSAGGALALLDAAEPDAAYRSVVSVYGLYDFAGVSGPGSRLWRTALLGSRSAEDWARTSPLAVADRIEAPMWLVHGTEDALVPFEQAERLVARRGGLPTTLRRFDGLRHGWLQDPSALASQTAVAEIADFLTSDPSAGS